MTDLNMMDMPATMRHQELLAEARREALAAQVSAKGPNIFAMIVGALKAILGR